MIGAVVLAAGLSQRMGRPKLILPWGKTTVIGRVVRVLSQAKVKEILVVTGGAQPEIERALMGTAAKTVFNPDFANGDMTRTLQVGLQGLTENIKAAFVVLGDQPQIELRVVTELMDNFQQSCAPLIVPSYQMRRGHPWLLARELWPAVGELRPPATMRDFLNRHLAETKFINLDTDSILQDLDTPEDYLRHRPKLRDSQ